MSENQPCGKWWFSNHDGRDKESGRQEVGPKGLVFFKKNGIPAFPNLLRPQKSREKRPRILWKKYRKVKKQRDIPTFFTGTRNAKSHASGK